MELGIKSLDGIRNAAIDFVSKKLRLEIYESIDQVNVIKEVAAIIEKIESDVKLKEITIKKIDKYINGNKSGIHMLMFIDFDDFKSINDHYGHLQGDKVLTFVIGRIKDIFLEGEIIGRIGGDEFVVFAGNINNVDEIMDKASILKNALDTTYHCDDNSSRFPQALGWPYIRKPVCITNN
jgi:predicted signal transduction protein with EAL and GGDEF domain